MGFATVKTCQFWPGGNSAAFWVFVLLTAATAPAPSNAAITAGFTTNDPSSSTDLVRFGSANCVNDMCNLDILIGATTESDYFAFAFDIIISDPTVARFVSGSDTAGSFLTGTVDSFATQIVYRNRF